KHGRQTLRLVERSFRVATPDSRDPLLRSRVPRPNEEEEVVRPLVREELVSRLRAENGKRVVQLVAFAPIGERPRPTHVFTEVVHPAVVTEGQRSPEKVLEP